MYDEDNEEVQPSAVISSYSWDDGSTYHQDNVLVSSGRWGGRADANGDMYIGFEFSGIVAVTKVSSNLLFFPLFFLFSKSDFDVHRRNSNTTMMFWLSQL